MTKCIAIASFPTFAKAWQKLPLKVKNLHYVVRVWVSDRKIPVKNCSIETLRLKKLALIKASFLILLLTSSKFYSRALMEMEHT
ncbi:MAG: hypothetical protein V7L11_00500 [Nostoc sp.]|uniref:hypothetical protein n=1 Tax=Nostoc sp. TaxID=1180 RepID=UPI002FFC78DF